jgi:hypothetical protein
LVREDRNILTHQLVLQPINDLMFILSL